FRGIEDSDFGVQSFNHTYVSIIRLTESPVNALRISDATDRSFVCDSKPFGYHSKDDASVQVDLPRGVRSQPGGACFPFAEVPSDSRTPALRGICRAFRFPPAGAGERRRLVPG